MKRYRGFGSEFDTRALSRPGPTGALGGASQARPRYNREQVRQGLIVAFGAAGVEQKLQNFIDLGVKPLSILAFHNQFFAQARSAFVIGAYYPALTGACALGERVLNHLILALREDHRQTPQYKRVYNKDSFDDWTVPIETLAAWDVLLPEAVAEFRRLRDHRNRALHFRPDVDTNARPLALAALKSLGTIIANQFSGFGPQPWFITGMPGAVYITKAWESRPFVRRLYVPNGALVGRNIRLCPCLRLGRLAT